MITIPVSCSVWCKTRWQSQSVYAVEYLGFGKGEEGMLPDSQRTFQQTRSFGLAAKPKTVPDHLLIGNALVVDLPSPGSIRSAGTQKDQWPTLCSSQKTARFGDKSQRRNATAERSASWWWWWGGHGERAEREPTGCGRKKWPLNIFAVFSATVWNYWNLLHSTAK